MVNPLQKLQLAQEKLNKLEQVNLSEVNSSNEISVPENEPIASAQNYTSGGQLKKLETVTGTNDFETFSIVGDSIPKRWCPEVIPKVNTIAEIEAIVLEVLEDTQEADVQEIVYNIFSDPTEPGLLVINGGTP